MQLNVFTGKLTLALGIMISGLDDVADARPMHAAIVPQYHRYLKEKVSLSNELDLWLKEYGEDGPKKGFIPVAESRSADDARENQMQRLFLSKVQCAEARAVNPDAIFGLNGPFTLMTMEEFHDFLANRHINGSISAQNKTSVLPLGTHTKLLSDGNVNTQLSPHWESDESVKSINGIRDVDKQNQKKRAPTTEAEVNTTSRQLRSAINIQYALNEEGYSTNWDKGLESTPNAYTQTFQQPQTPYIDTGSSDVNTKTEFDFGDVSTGDNLEIAVLSEGGRGGSSNGAWWGTNGWGANDWWGNNGWGGSSWWNPWGGEDPNAGETDKGVSTDASALPNLQILSNSPWPFDPLSYQWTETPSSTENDQAPVTQSITFQTPTIVTDPSQASPTDLPVPPPPDPTSIPAPASASVPVPAPAFDPAYVQASVSLSVPASSRAPAPTPAPAPARTPAPTPAPAPARASAPAPTPTSDSTPSLPVAPSQASVRAPAPAPALDSIPSLPVAPSQVPARERASAPAPTPDSTPSLPVAPSPVPAREKASASASTSDSTPSLPVAPVPRSVPDSTPALPVAPVPRSVPDSTPALPVAPVPRSVPASTPAHAPDSVPIQAPVPASGSAIQDVPSMSNSSITNSDSVDWSTSSCVRDPDTQGQCASCWAFTTVAALEAAQCLHNGDKKAPMYSKQQLVSCNTMNSGCNGGSAVYAMEYIRDNGICTESSYQYTSKDGGQAAPCMACTPAKPKISEIRRINPGDEKTLISVAKHQPVIASVVSNNIVWKQYISGVITSCPTATVDHSVLVVGYDATTLKIMNSWGTEWGENGYARISRSSQGMGTCEVLTDMSYPKL